MPTQINRQRGRSQPALACTHSVIAHRWERSVLGCICTAGLPVLHTTVCKDKALVMAPEVQTAGQLVTHLLPG